MNNENDFKVVKIKNISNFEFTPALGAMFDGRPIFGSNGMNILVGEELTMPYHIGHRIAVNLAKQILLRGDVTAINREYGKGDPVAHGVLFTEDTLNALIDKIFVAEYQEEKPMVESETDKLMKKFDELNKVVESLKEGKISNVGYQDKAEVIAELERRGIPHDKRANKAKLEELLK